MSELNRRSVESEIREKQDNAMPAMMQITLLARDTENLKRFYEYILGVEASSREGVMTMNDYRFNIASGTLIITKMDEEEEAERGAKSHVRITMNVGTEEQVNNMFAKLRNAENSRVIRAPHYSKNNRYQLLVEDPEGNELLFCE